MTTYTLNRLPYKEDTAEELGTYRSYYDAQEFADAYNQYHEADYFFVTEDKDFVITEC